MPDSVYCYANGNDLISFIEDRLHDFYTASKGGGKECLSNKLKEMLKQVVGKTQRTKPKCFNCGKYGHFQRNYKAPRKQSILILPTRQRVIATHKASYEHNVETIHR